ncbi:MAG: glycoside hydrolase family 95 protein [Capnocytophaga sp.]|nr:glycoside hydrolase family 95 protein [Capnocytophaga sp.]
MKNFFFIISSFPLFCFAQKADTQIVFDKPAQHFTESLPVGNGRLGAMLFGGTEEETIILNEISMWSGGENNSDSPDAHLHLQPIQNLLLEGKNEEAQALLQKHFVTTPENGSCFGNGKDCHYGSYQILAKLQIQWEKNDQITDYKRILDIENALATTSYKRNNIPVKERLFADFQNDILWLEIQSEQNILDLSLNLIRDENVSTDTISDNQFILEGQLSNYKGKGLRYSALASVHTDGISETNYDRFIIKNAKKILLKITASTNYNFINGGLISDKNTLEECHNLLKNTNNITFEDAYYKNKVYYSSFFNKNRWNMPNNDKILEHKTTFERLKSYYNGKKDNQLPVLYYNFGKYLLISSSKKGFLPANLQGLWTDDYQCPWNGDYHININLQMNYWLAEQTRLTEQAEPLFRFTKNLVPNGEKTAKSYYKSDGWVAHAISNPWFFTSPGEGAEWGSTLTGGAWLCQHLWQHYLFTQDIDFLREYYPILKKSALFFENFLIKDPKTGFLVTAPSNSPENSYLFQRKDGSYTPLNTCFAPTMDMQIVRELFSNLKNASEILQIDKKERKKWQKIIKQTAPNQIGKDGDLNEWLHDWKDAEPQHRHVSHLYGLYPYDEITPWNTPKLALACQKTLEQRGDDGTGWAMAWKINFWARLGDGNHALLLFNKLLRPVENNPKTPTMSGGGTYPNLFCAHPPFQIDGNFGGAAGLTEMLLQSHGKDNVIRFLPALPSEPDWQTGTFSGAKARGGFIVDFQWDKGKITNAKITSTSNNKCFVLLPKGMYISNSEGKIIHKKSHKKDRIVSFQTTKEKYFVIQ